MRWWAVAAENAVGSVEPALEPVFVTAIRVDANAVVGYFPTVS